MKKKTIILLILFISIIIVTGCPMYTGIPKGWNGDPTNPDDITGGSGDSSDWDKIFLHQGYNCFDLQIWEATANAVFTNNSLKVTANSVGWMGGGIVSNPNAETKLDLSAVAKIKFKFRTNMAANLVRFYVQVGKDGIDKKLLSERNVTPSATNWTSCTINLAGTNLAILKQVTHPFVILGEGGTKAGDWIEVKDIDFLDASDKQVVIGYAQ